MKQLSSFCQTFNQLPNTLPIFPLANAVFLPGGHLPLNIFEPRYVNMVQDAIKSDQLIGMIQPKSDRPDSALYKVGCAGRITRYEETHDERIEVLLTGLCRFEIDKELTCLRGYRRVIPNWSNFKQDYKNTEEPDSQTALLFKHALRVYLKRNEINVDWPQLEKANLVDLSNSLFSYLPLSNEDKQILIETDSVANRIAAFAAILENDNLLSSKTEH